MEFFLWSRWTRERWIVRRNLLKRCSLFSSDGHQYPVTSIWRASKRKRHFLSSTCVWKSTFPSFSTLLFLDGENIAVDVLLFRSWSHTSIERITFLVFLRKKNAVTRIDVELGSRRVWRYWCGVFLVECGWLIKTSWNFSFRAVNAFGDKILCVQDRRDKT